MIVDIFRSVVWCRKDLVEPVESALVKKGPRHPIIIIASLLQVTHSSLAQIMPRRPDA